MNANGMNEKLYSLQGRRTAGNTSDEVRNELLTCLIHYSKIKLLR
jgi:hypothetical protein